ncbi:MAG: glycosyltransferase family 9 protein [Egibacteraceae bacterium]
MTHVLIARLDNDGDVLLAGPAVRAVAASADQVTLWCGPRGRAAGALLPGVDVLFTHAVPWIDPQPEPVERTAMLALVEALAGVGADEAIVLTSFHQSPLPTALLLRMAGLRRVVATSVDYPGSLLDVRHRVDEDVHEVERSLSLVAELGYRLPAGDLGTLAVALPQDDTANPAREAGYVVVHPGASVPARAWEPQRCAATVDALLASGWRVVVTGSPSETDLTARVAGPTRPGVTDLGGTTTFATLARVLAGAAAVVVGNTGPAHLAAAVGTPVVSLYAPTVPAARWRPWGVPHELLGDQRIACAGCRAQVCPLPGHPCLDAVLPDDVVAAVRRLLAGRDHTTEPLVAASSLSTTPAAEEVAR